MKRAQSEESADYKKRKYEKTSEVVRQENSSTLSSTLLLFKQYQTELDAKHDKYDRLSRKGRELTKESKRVIFLLHRVNSSENKDEILNQGKHRISELMKTLVNDIGLELNKKEVFLHMNAFHNGLEEFVEAVSFYYYLKNGTLITFEKMCEPDFLEESSETPEVPIQESILPLSEFLTPVHYVLGIADLTGELMRKCIYSAAYGNIKEPLNLCLLLQIIYKALLTCIDYPDDLKQKLITMRCSVEKCEKVCYNIKLSGKEFPNHTLAEFFPTENKI